LDIYNSPTDEYLLKYDSGNGMTWQRLKTANIDYSGSYPPSASNRVLLYLNGANDFFFGKCTLADLYVTGSAVAYRPLVRSSAGDISYGTTLKTT
jgi:hypothetical protein